MSNASTLTRSTTGLAAALVAVLLAGCSAAPDLPVTGHWADPGAQLVDGRWIGPATPCAGSAPCALIVEVATDRGPRAAGRKGMVSRVVLPSTFITESGETRNGMTRHGLDTLVAALVELTDGTRLVVGMACSLPLDDNGTFLPGRATCTGDPLTTWMDGNTPPSYPPEPSSADQAGAASSEPPPSVVSSSGLPPTDP
jgi:hypothetical protein